MKMTSFFVAAFAIVGLTNAADLIPPKTTIVNVGGGSDPTKLPLAGGTMTGSLTMAATAQVVIGSSPNSVYGSQGPLVVRGHDAQGVVALFNSGAGSVGSFIHILTTSATPGTVGLVVSSGTIDESLLSLSYNSTTGELLLEGPASHGEFSMLSNGNIVLDPNTGGVTVINSSVTVTGAVSASSNVVAGGSLVAAQGASITGGATISGQVSMGWERVSATCLVATSCTVTCNSPRRVLGGGCETSDVLTDAYPDTDTSFQCVTPIPTTINAYALCARMGP